MRKILKRLSVVLIIMALLVPSVMVKAEVMSISVKSLEASAKGNVITVKGTVGPDNVYAVTVILTDKSDTALMIKTEQVNEKAFTVKFFDVPNGEYVVKAAKYEGGEAFKTTTVKVEKEPEKKPAGGVVSGGNSSSESYSASVSGETKVEIGAEISNGTAAVKEISKENIEKVISKETNDSIDVTDKVVIDLSDAKTNVSAVTLSKTTVETLKTVAEDPNNSINTIEIKLSEASVSFDAKALNAIGENAAGSDINVSVKIAEQSILNASQKEAVSEYEVSSVIDAVVLSNGTPVSDFKGGNVTMSINFKPKSGQDIEHFHVYYLSKDGEMTLFPTIYLNNAIEFTTGHFSEYVVVYDETLENDTYVTVHRLFNRRTGEHLLSADENEVAYLLSTGIWSEDAPVGKAAREGVSVYRLFNKVNGGHLFTSDENEVKNHMSGNTWVCDNGGKPVFYGLEKGKGVYRLFNIRRPGVSAHLDSSDQYEIGIRTKEGYVIENNEKPMFYVLDK